MNEVERLRKYTKDIQEQLRIEKELKKNKPNVNMDQDIPERLFSFDFYCDTCQEDFKSSAVKTKKRLDGDVIATMRGKCPNCGNEAIRYATHRDQDSYYQKSPKIRRQRNYFKQEMLQKDEYGFKTLYGDKDEEFYKRMKEKEEEIFNEELSIGLKGNSLLTQEKLRVLHESRH